MGIQFVMFYGILSFSKQMKKVNNNINAYYITNIDIITTTIIFAYMHKHITISWCRRILYAL